MNKKQIIEGNTLIAKYVGYGIDEINGVVLGSHKDNGEPTIPILKIEDLHYHNRWDFIMPVVEKIALDYDISIWWYDKECICTIKNTSIEHSEVADFGNFTPAITNVWLAIVQLLKSLK